MSANPVAGLITNPAAAAQVAGPAAAPGLKSKILGMFNNRKSTEKIKNEIAELQLTRNKLMADIQNANVKLRGQMSPAAKEQIAYLQNQLAVCEDNFLKRFGRSFEDYFREASMSFSKTENELIIAGERVYMLDDAPNMDEIVTFQRYYFPNDAGNDDKLGKAKVVFKVIFDDVVDKDEIPAPICTKDENNYLLEGLKNRFISLREEVKRRRYEFGDSLYSRQALEHFLRLTKMINAYEDKLIRCIDPGILDKYAPGPLPSLDPDEIEQLLRTFTFMVLQNIYPNEHFGHIEESRTMVQLLKDNEINSQTLNTLINNTDNVPQIILDIANISEKGTSTHLDRAANNKLRDIVRELISIIEAAELDYLIRGLDINNPKDFIIRSFQNLIQAHRECISKIERLNGAKYAHTAQIDKLQNELTKNRGKIASIQSKYQISTSDKKVDIESRTNAITAPLTERIKNLTAEIDKFKRDNQRLNVELESVKGKNNILQDAFKRIQGVFESKTGQVGGDGQVGGASMAKSDSDLLLEKIRKAKQDSDKLAALEAEVRILKGQAQPEVVNSAEAAAVMIEKDAKIKNITAEISEKEAEIEKLEKQNVVLSETNTDYKNQIIDLQGKFENLTTQHEEKTTASEQKDTIIKELTAEIEQLKPLAGSKDTADAATSKLAELEVQLQATISENDAIKNDKTNIQLQLVQLQSQLSSAKNKLDSAKIQATADAKIITDLRTQLAAINEKHSELTNAYSLLEVQHNEKITQVAEYESKLAKLNADLQSQEKELDKIQKTTINLDTLTSENESLKDIISKNETTQNGLKSQITDLRSEINQHTRKSGELELEKNNIKITLDETKDKLNELTATNATLTDKIKQLTKDNTDQQYTIDSLDKKMVSENKKYEDSLNKVKKAKEHLIVKVKALTQSLGDSNKTKLELDDLSREHTSAKSELDEKTSQITDLTGKIANVATLNEELKKLKTSALDGEELQRQINELNTALQAMTTEKNKLQKSDTTNRGIIKKIPLLLQNIKSGKLDGFMKGNENDKIFIDILNEVNGKLGIVENPNKEIQIKNLCVLSYFSFYFLEAIFHKTPHDMKNYIALVKNVLFPAVKELFKNIVPNIKDEEVYYQIIMCLSSLFYAAEYYVLSNTATPSIVIYKEDSGKAKTRSGILELLIQSLDLFQTNESKNQFFDIYRGISFNSVKDNFTYFVYNRDSDDEIPINKNKIFTYNGKNTSVKDMTESPDSNIDRKPSALTYDIAFRIFLIATMQFLESKKTTLVELKCSLPFSYLGGPKLPPAQEQKAAFNENREIQESLPADPIVENSEVSRPNLRNFNEVSMLPKKKTRVSYPLGQKPLKGGMSGRRTLRKNKV